MLRLHVFPSLFAGVLLSVSSASGANQVLVVDESFGPGADFVSIYSAIQAAGDGDIVLVRPGQYGSATIDGKSLTLIGDVGQNGEHPELRSILIRNIGPGQSAVVRGLNISSNPILIGQTESVRVADCAGPVVFEDLSAMLEWSFYGQPMAVRIQNSARVSFTRCSLRGAPSVEIQKTPARSGIEATGSAVFLYDSEVWGGDGQDALVNIITDQDALPGAIAVSLITSTLATVGCTIRGGDGGDGFDTGALCRPSADGGVGLVVDGGGIRMDTLIAGGSGGTDPAGCPQIGSDGADVVVQAGAVQTFNETLRSLEIDSPIRVGQPSTTTYSGVPGEPVGLLLSLNTSLTYAPGLKGALLPGAPLNFIGLGVVPASGVIQFTVPVPGVLSPGLEGIGLFGQALAPGQSGFGLLSSPTAIVIVDAAH